MTTERIVTPILYTADEVAKLLRCSKRTIQRMVERGDLAAVRASAVPNSRLLFRAKDISDLLDRAKP